MDFVDVVSHYLNEYESALKKQVDKQIENIRRVLHLCESPIEQIFLIKIVRHFEAILLATVEGMHIHFMALLPAAPGTERFRIRIYPQYPLNIVDSNNYESRDYRIDFFITADRDDIYYHKSGFETHVRLAVELDGHDFHERTKEQARRDKSRDRFLNRNGIIVFRYTGSEVHNNIDAIIDEIDSYVYNQIGKIVEEVGP